MRASAMSITEIPVIFIIDREIDKGNKKYGYVFAATEMLISRYLGNSIEDYLFF